MASGRVDAELNSQNPSIPKTWGGFPSPSPPNAPAQPFGAQLGVTHGLLLLLHVPSNIQYLLFFFSWKFHDFL